LRTSGTGQQAKFIKRKYYQLKVGFSVEYCRSSDNHLALDVIRGSGMFGRKKSQESRTPWNKGKLVGQKAPFTLQEILTSD
jgi:hypothetical protein